MRYISETAAGYIYENSAKEHKGNTRGYMRPYYSGALGSSAMVSPGTGGLRSKKRDAQSNLYASLSMLCTLAVWRWTYRYTGAVARGRGLRIDKNASQAGASQKRTVRMEKCERG